MVPFSSWLGRLGVGGKAPGGAGRTFLAQYFAQILISLNIAQNFPKIAILVFLGLRGAPNGADVVLK